MDIFIPSKNIGIEYNGYRWHKGLEKEMRDHIKQVYFEEHDIRLLRVIEIEKKIQYFGNFSVENEDLYYVNDNDDEGLADTIEELIFDIFGKRIFIDIDSFRSRIYESYDLNEKKWSFANDDGGCLFEWDYEKNGGLKPEYISRRSGKVVYWKCKKGHSFRKSPHGIYLLKTCPECAKESVYNNRFELSHPELLREWDYEKNVGISTDEITCGSSRKIWWKCKNGHGSWRAPISTRIKGCGCPLCGRQKVREKKYKRVAQFDLKGNFIREWDGAKVAQEKLGISHVANACSGCRQSAGGFKWKYIDK